MSLAGTIMLRRLSCSQRFSLDFYLFDSLDDGKGRLDKVIHLLRDIHAVCQKGMSVDEAVRTFGSFE